MDEPEWVTTWVVHAEDAEGRPVEIAVGLVRLRGVKRVGMRMGESEYYFRDTVFLRNQVPGELIHIIRLAVTEWMKDEPEIGTP